MNPATAAPAATEAKATLLFVDDEPNILSALQRLFRPAGYRIFTAPGGVEGLALLEREKIDLIVSDMRMPQMDGAAFLEQAAKRWPQTVRILLTGYADLTSAVAAVNRGNIYRYLSKPWEDNDIKLTIAQALERQRLESLVAAQNAELKELNNNLEARVRARTEEVRQVLAQLELTHDELKKTYVTAVKVFANLIEMRQQHSAGHASRVAEQILTLLPRLRLPDGDAQALHFAALLHDIGKIGFPDRLLQTPYDHLSASDRELYHQHPVVGQNALLALESLQDAASLIRAHREHLDGSGYPDALQGEQIPLGARALLIVSDYDALVHGLRTGTPLTPRQAQDILIAHKGKRYDGRVVEIYLDILRAPPPATERELTTDQLQPGMVLARDLRNGKGLMLIGKGRELSAALIPKLQAIEKQEGARYAVYVVKS
jgi:response regulator RpfG family c-di-GMP phosphodiesterase